MKPRVLVTGASGMLGHLLCQKLALSGEVFGISKSGRGQTVACDLAHQDQILKVFSEFKPTLVINTAAYSDVDGCERDPQWAFEANATGVKHLADLCGRFQTPLVHISTDYVFDGMKGRPYVEMDPVGPVNIYGLSKLHGEFYAAQCQSPAVILRTSWLFGPGNPSNFVNAIRERMKTSEVVSVLDDQIGAPMYTADLVAVIEKIIGSLGRLPSHEKCPIFHVCNSGSTTRYEMTLMMKKILKLDSLKVTKIDPKSIQGRLAVRPPYGAMSNHKLEAFLGVELRPWEKSLEEYLLCAS